MDAHPNNVIKLSDDLFPALLDGRKRLTIRKGMRSYTLGDAVLEATHGTREPVPIFIYELSCSPLVDVTEDVLQEDGFKDWEDLAAGLREYYPDLKDADMVTLVRFSVPTAPR